MIRLVWRTDVHLSDAAPESRKDDWTETVLGKLRQVGLVASRLQAAAVLDGGDFFHVKSPMRNTHTLMRQVADVHAAYTCPTFGNVGNHDCVYGDYEYLHQQPLGVLFSANVFGRCYDGYEVFFGPADTETATVKVYPFERGGRGWVNGDPFGQRANPIVPIVRVVGIPYHGTKYDPQRFHGITRGQEDHLVAMAHVLASPTGGTMFEGEDIIRYDSLAHLAPTMWLFGHWHKDQGVTEIGDKTIVNIGSLTRGSLTQDEMARRPACAVLSFTKEAAKVQVVRLKVAPPEEVFDVEGKQRAETRVTNMDAFVESIRKRLGPDQGLSVEEVVRRMENVPERVRERVLSYMERAGT